VGLPFAFVVCFVKRFRAVPIWCVPLFAIPADPQYAVLPADVKVACTFKAHAASVRHTCVIPEPFAIVSCGDDDTVRVWDGTGVQIGVLDVPPPPADRHARMTYVRERCPWKLHINLAAIHVRELLRRVPDVLFVSPGCCVTKPSACVRASPGKRESGGCGRVE
jgi:hypothetical protein